jgi:nucleosome assembly protein 1-like 1
MSGSVQTEKRYPKVPEDIENEKDIIEEIKKLTPLSLKLKAFALNHHTLELKELGTQEEEEIAKITAESDRNFQQHLHNINDVINGARAPTDDELKNIEQYLDEEERGKKAELSANLKPLPEYWAKVLKNDPVIKTHINENDEKALKHLSRVEYKYSEDTKTPYNFSVTMHFTPNEYFENEILTVTFHMQEPRDVTKTEGTEIKWKSGVNFTKKTVTKKQKNKKSGQMRTVTKEEIVPSFFNLFRSIEAPAEDKDKELEEEEMQLQNDILDQVDIGYALIEEAIPFSLEYYLGVRKDFLPGEDDEDYGEDDEDDDEEEDAPKPKGKGKAPAGGKGGDAAKQDCKQQ